MLASLRQRPLVMVGVTYLILVLLVIIFPRAVADDPSGINLSATLIRPWTSSGERFHLLGTDQLGRDIWARLVFGARVSVAIAVTVTLIRAGVGGGLGLVAGYFGGRLDSVVMRLADVQLALPFLVLAIPVMAIVRPGLEPVILLLSATGWMIYGRTVRSVVLSMRHREFIEAARAVGAFDSWLLRKHMLPHVYPYLIVLGSVDMARVILTEAALSYLGLGIPPHIPSLGAMVADGQQFLTTAWWVATAPGIAIALTALAVNIVGDWMRDILDPTIRN